MRRRPFGWPLRLIPGLALGLLFGCSTTPPAAAPRTSAPDAHAEANPPMPPPEAVSPPAGDAPVDPEKEVVVRLEQGEMADLSARALADLAEAEDLLARIDRTNWGAEERDRLASVLDMMASARTALKDEDYDAAATLARKARLLSTELAGG